MITSALAQKYIQTLRQRLTGAQWPLATEADYHKRINQCIALRSSDARALRPSRWGEEESGRDFFIDPLGQRLPWVWADLLYDEEPTMAPVNKADASRMDDMINFNRLASELHRAEWLCASEGEVWWRSYPNETFGHASIEFHSRLNVLPLWVAKRCVACAFVTELYVDDKTHEVWRYVEIHVDGFIHRELFKGTEKDAKVGIPVGLSDRPETADLDSETETDTEMCAGRIVNQLGENYRFGESIYTGLGDLLRMLNEAITVGHENMRLTAKQRAIVPQRFLDMYGSLPKDRNILVATDVDQDPEKIKNDVAMVEFSFDASNLIAYTENLTDTTLTRARVAPQLVGRHTEGAQTGPALKARLVDSELCAEGKGKPWDDAMPHALNCMISLERKLLKVGWSTFPTGTYPAFKRADALPEDPEAVSRRLAVAVNADFLSRKTAIQESHPEWDAARVDDEMNQIEKEAGMGLAPAPDAAGGNSIPPQQRPAGGTPTDRQPTPAPGTGTEKDERR